MASLPPEPSFNDQELFRWLVIVKKRIEDIDPGSVTISAAQVTSGVFDPARIPSLPFSRLTLDASPRLIGRTTAGTGAAEEISVGPEFTLTGQLLRLRPTVPTAPLLTGLPMPWLDREDSSDGAWALAAVPRAVVGATGAQGLTGMDGRDAESGDDPWAWAAQMRPVVTVAPMAFAPLAMDGRDGDDGGYWPAPSSGVISTATGGVTGSGTSGNLAQWSSASVLTDGPVASNVPLLNAANVFTAAQTAPTLRGTLNTTAPASGVGTELTYVAGSGYGVVFAYDRSGTGYKPMHLDGSLLAFDVAGTTRWGINAAGDFTFGASSHLALSSGVPTIASGFGTGPSIVGNDYGFTVTVGTGGVSGTGLVNLGHTHSSAPAAVASSDNNLLTVSSSTTQINISSPTSFAVGAKIYVIVHGN